MEQANKIEEMLNNAPTVEESKSPFMAASESNERAETSFRKRLASYIIEAVESGANKLTVEVSAVDKDLVNAVQSELEELGYGVTFKNVHVAPKGYNKREMIITY